MFGTGWTEMLVIGVVALIVIGPKDLPVVMRRIGKMVASVRRMGSDFQREIAKTTGLEEIGDLRRSLTDPLRQTSEEIAREFNSMTSKGVEPSGIMKPLDPEVESVYDNIANAAAPSSPPQIGAPTKRKSRASTASKSTSRAKKKVSAPASKDSAPKALSAKTPAAKTPAGKTPAGKTTSKASTPKASAPKSSGSKSSGSKISATKATVTASVESTPIAAKAPVKRGPTGSGTPSSAVPKAVGEKPVPRDEGASKPATRTVTRSSRSSAAAAKTSVKPIASATAKPRPAPSGKSPSKKA